MSEDSKQKRVDNGRSLLDDYLKKKQHESHRKSKGAEVEGAEEKYHSSRTSSFDDYLKKKQHESHRKSKGAEMEGAEEKYHSSITSSDGDKNRMDSPTLQKNTSNFISLKATIQQLQDTVSGSSKNNRPLEQLRKFQEKNETIDALMIENKMLRQGKGDGTYPERTYEEKIIRDLQAMVDARDTYIQQLSDSLQKRSEELTHSLNKEKLHTNEIQNLQVEVQSTLKESEVKLNESSVELVGYKAKIEVLKSQVKEYSDMSNSLKVSLDSSNAKIEVLQQEILEKDKKIELLKSQTAEDIKSLMKLVEELNYNISKKDKEVIQSKKEIEILRSCMDEQIGGKIGAIRAEFEKKYEEDVRKVEVMYDNMMLEHIRKSDTELKSIDKCSDLEKQIASCRQTYELEITKYKEELSTLLEKSKQTEEVLLIELEKHKQEADKYKQQVENMKSDLSEEIHKIKSDCYLELDKYELQLNSLRSDNVEEIQCYQKEIDKLGKQLQIYAVNEASKEVELETLRHELKNREVLLTAKLDELEEYKDAFQMQSGQLSQLQRELNNYKDVNSQVQSKLYEFQMSEHKLLHEIKMSNSKIEDYKSQMFSLNEQIRADTEKFEEMNQAFQTQVQSLMNALESNKTLHQADVSHLTSVINEQQVEISSLRATINEYQEQLNAIEDHNEDLPSDSTNKEFLLGIWNTLTNIQTQIKTLFEPNKLELISHIEQNGISDEYLANITVQELTLEVKNTVDNVLDMTQYLQQNESELSHSQCLLTSTPNVNNHSKKVINDTNMKYGPQMGDVHSSESLNYAKLEEENASLRRNLKLMMDNLIEMETCLIIVSQESNLFNKKCQILDGKLTELESSKLSEYLLKKENDNLKLRLKTIEDSEEKLFAEFSVLQENNMKLETTINKYISVQLQNAGKNESNSELKCLLIDLNEKSNEIIDLKTQVASLQTSNKELKSRMLDIQSEYEYFISKHNFLTAELNSKTKELEEIWQEKYKLFTENKFLYRKLAFQRKLPDKNSNNPADTVSEYDNTITLEAENDEIQECDKEIFSIPESMQKCTMNTIDSQELISNSLNVSRSTDNRILNYSASMDRKNFQEYRQLHKIQENNNFNYHMPTILEEDDKLEEDQSNYDHTKQDQFQVGGHLDSKVRVYQPRGSLMQCRSSLALRQLLSVLFDEYMASVKKMVLPWKDECQTLDFNLKKDLDKRTTDKVIYENRQFEATKTGGVNVQVEHEGNTGLNSGIAQVEHEDNTRRNSGIAQVEHEDNTGLNSGIAQVEHEDNTGLNSGIAQVEHEDNTGLNSDSIASVPERCVKALFFLKKRLDTAHDAVLQSINIKKEELEKSCTIILLKEEIKFLKAEQIELEKEHKSAIELLIKDHEHELGMVNNLITVLQKDNPVKIVTEDSEAVRQELEQKYQKEMEQLRTYCEKRCADLEKQYSEEVYSQSQRSCKEESVNSSLSDLGNMADLFGGPGDELQQQETEERLHAGCEKSISDLKELCERLQEKYSIELESVKSDYEMRLSDSVCKVCSNSSLIDHVNQRNNQSGVTLEQYFTEKIKETKNNRLDSCSNTDLELKVYQIKEDVRKDYEQEIEKIREEIVNEELKKRDKELSKIKTQLNEELKKKGEELNMIKSKMENEMASKEVENSYEKAQNQVMLSQLTQEVDEKIKLIEELNDDKRELVTKLKVITKQKQKEMEQLKSDLSKAHNKEVENLMQAFEIKINSRLGSVLEEKAAVEEELKKQIEKLEDDLKKTKYEKDSYQSSHSQDMQQLTESIRKDILRSLELQIKAMVASGDGKEEWPPELAALERQFTAKYQQQLTQLVKEHALEIAGMKAEYDARLSELVKECSIREAEGMPVAKLSTGDEELDKIIRERDNLRSLALTLRQVVQELAGYLTSCEDELNKSIVGELLKLASPHNGFKKQLYASENETSDSDVEVVSQKKVHFAPDVSSIVSLMEEDCLFDCLENSVDVSVHFRSELEACLERLREEAATVLGLTQLKDRAVRSTVEDRRLSSLTRQLIEEKKAKDKAISQLQDLQLMFQTNEQELIEVHKELLETKERMVKEKVAVEAEYSEKQCEETEKKLCLLQEKARSMLSEKGECPPQWLELIEELCTTGDSLVDEVSRARDQLQFEVEAADKQLRSTRAFLEEQAAEREQERDEFTKEIAKLTEQLREKDRDWTSHKHFTTEVEALEQQVQETTELLKDTEEKKVKVEEELKAAVDKIWVLRDIISELEVQVCNRGQREASLEQRLAQMESELDAQAKTHTDMLQQLGELRDNTEKEDKREEQPRSPGQPALRQVKSQLRGMARSLEKPIKELEALNIHVSCGSLSSPSEDISVREQLEALRCSTPEGKGSSPPSPVHIEEISLLSDKLQRYARAAETIIKKLGDREMEIVRLRAQNEELVAEKEVLQGQSERQILQLASLHNKVEELRGRSERDTASAVAPLHQRILQLEGRVSEQTDQLAVAQRQINKLRQKLERSESVVASQESELSSLSLHQHELVDKLRHDLRTMQAEKQQLQSMVEKYRCADNVSFPLLVEVMLAEKNADIDQLQQRVDELEAQQEHKSTKNQQSKSRGYRVSFADDISHSQLGEGDRARDAYDNSSLKPVFSTPVSSFENGEKKLAPRVIGEDISKIQEPPIFNLNSSPNRAIQLESALSQLKSELEQKTQKLLECEAQLSELPRMEQELTKAKEELMETVSAVDNDKRFYESQLKTLGDTLKTLEEREAELAQVKEELVQKEEDIEKTTKDVKDLQEIMVGLQEKLKEARKFAENCGEDQQAEQSKKVDEKYVKESNIYKEKVGTLEEQITALNKDLKGEREACEVQQEIIKRLEVDKQNLLSELVMTKSKCKSLQEDLEKALTSVSKCNDKIVSLTKDLELSFRENETLNANCQRLKKDFDQLSRKQKSDLKNMLKKDSDEVLRMKEEIVSLKTNNSELQSACEHLQKEVQDLGNNVDLLNELNTKDNKIQQLELELKELDINNETLKTDKSNIENSLNMEISGLKSLIDDLNKNIESMGGSSHQAQEDVQERERKDTLARRYEVLKREYDRQRRARREYEKKCTILKEELTKEKQFSARLQNGGAVKQVPKLEIAKAFLIDVKPYGMKDASSLDDLTDEVQKELNASAQLDQSLITGLQHSTEHEKGERSEMLPPRTDFLRSRLAEAEMALHYERLSVSELRARLTEERTRHAEQRSRADSLARDLAEAQLLNDQFEDKFKNIAHQFEQQLLEIKSLRKHIEPTKENGNETEKLKLKRLLEEYQKRVEELTQERVFNRNQLTYMREELSKLRAEKAVRVEKEELMQGDINSLDKLRDDLELERMKNAELQRCLDQSATEVIAMRCQLDALEKKFKGEMEERRSLEEKIKIIELVEKNRHNRRRVAEMKLKDLLTQTEKEKKKFEHECLALQLKLKQTNLQLAAQSAESPLALRLMEANIAVERLVGEKEDMNSAIAILKEEKRELQSKLKNKDDLIEELKSKIHSLNLKVTDGGLDNLNAMFAAEREAWMKEKESLRSALAQRNQNCCSTDSYNSCGNSDHILQRFLRAESHRIALVWQKRYLLVVLKSYQEEERHTIDVLSRLHTPPPLPSPSPERKFRVAVCAVRAVFRLQFMIQHRRRSHQNTCRLLRQALNNPIIVPRSAENVPEMLNLWRRTEGPTSSQSTQPASLAQYLSHFNAIQDRIKNTLSTES